MSSALHYFAAAVIASPVFMIAGVGIYDLGRWMWKCVRNPHPLYFTQRGLSLKPYPRERLPFAKFEEGEIPNVRFIGESILFARQADIIHSIAMHQGPPPHITILKNGVPINERKFRDPAGLMKGFDWRKITVSAPEIIDWTKIPEWQEELA